MGTSSTVFDWGYINIEIEMFTVKLLKLVTFNSPRVFGFSDKDFQIA